MTGRVATRFLDASTLGLLSANYHRFSVVDTGTAGCAGANYAAVAEGRRHFSLYWRTLPWDHAPGALLIKESGGAALRLDGSTTYGPSQDDEGLLVTFRQETWPMVHQAPFHQAD